MRWYRLRVSWLFSCKKKTPCKLFCYKKQKDKREKPWTFFRIRFFYFYMVQKTIKFPCSYHFGFRNSWYTQMMCLILYRILLLSFIYNPIYFNIKARRKWCLKNLSSTLCLRVVLYLYIYMCTSYIFSVLNIQH